MTRRLKIGEYTMEAGREYMYILFEVSALCESRLRTDICVGNGLKE